MKNYRLQAFVLISVAFILGFSEFIIIGIVDNLSQQFNVSESNVGFLVTIFALIYAVSTPIINLLIGSQLLHLVLFTLMFIFEIGNLETALANNFFWLTSFRIITSIVSGAIISVAISLELTQLQEKSVQEQLLGFFSDLALQVFLVFH